MISNSKEFFDSMQKISGYNAWGLQGTFLASRNGIPLGAQKHSQPAGSVFRIHGTNAQQAESNPATPIYGRWPRLFARN